METIKNFNIKRLLLMLQKDIFDSLKYVLIGYSSIIGILLLFMIILSEGNASENLSEIYIAAMLITGIFISGMAFNDFRVKEKTMTYLTLPASLFEKLLSMLILTTIGFVLSFTIVFYIFNGLAIILGSSVFSFELGFLNIFNKSILDAVIGYLYIQSFFLAGAATFKKAPFFLTLLILLAIGIIFSIYSVGLSYAVFHDVLSTYGKSPDLSIKFGPNGFGTEYVGFEIASKIFMNSLVPLLWFIIYFKLKEKEV